MHNNKKQEYDYPRAFRAYAGRSRSMTAENK